MTLIRIAWRHLTKHLWQSILMIVGIMLGVAVAVGVDIANVSAKKAFDLSTETIAGKATHQIVGSSQGLDQEIYTRLRRSGVIQLTAPIISQYVLSPELGSRPIQLLGVDPFVEQPFRSYLASDSAQASQDLSAATRPTVIDLTSFLTQPGAILLVDSLAERYGLGQGQQITLQSNGQSSQVTIVGILQPDDSLSRRALESLLITDLATAQEISGRLKTLDRIDLILPEDLNAPCYPGSPSNLGCLEAIQQYLPDGTYIQAVDARTGTVEQMTNAFRLNLTALSLLALVVGMFLIYNTTTFSVVQRRTLLGTLRCLGVTRREVFLLILLEAFVVGLFGSVLGICLGVLLGQGAVRLVTQTINDLFFVITVRGIQIPIESIVKGIILGVGTTLITAAPPAWEAASVPPRSALSRSGLESKTQTAIHVSAIIGMLLIFTGTILLILIRTNLLVSFAATFAIIVGLAMLAPFITRWFMQKITPILGRIWGILGKMAPRDVIKSLSRTSIAVMALMVAISVTIGVSLMVSSFRYTVIAWLEQTLQGDIYLSAPGLTATTPSGDIQEGIITLVSNLPEVARTDLLRAITVDSPFGAQQIAAINNPTIANERKFINLSLNESQVWDEMQKGAVLVSEPLINRLGLPLRGGQITLYTDNGPQQFPIIGVYYDYASTSGNILMALPVYRSYWDDNSLTGIALRLKPEVDSEQLVRKLQDEIGQNQNLLIRSNKTLREEVLVVFDRTFAITGALQLLATLVAFIGVLSSLLSLELERQREIGILRSIGLTSRQLFRLILLETGLMGFVAGMLAIPTGYILSLILVYIINRRSFGWTLQTNITAEPFINALILAIIAALIAGIYPALRMGRMVTSEALRSE